MEIASDPVETARVSLAPGVASPHVHHPYSTACSIPYLTLFLVFSPLYQRLD